MSHHDGAQLVALFYFEIVYENSTTTEPVQLEEDDNYDEDQEDDEDGTRYNESNFQFADFAKRLTHPKIVGACSLALKNFDSNSVHTNHCIVKLLHRIAFDCKMYVMVFQLSIFRVFQRVFKVKDLPEHKELVKFATYIVRQFIKVAETNKKVFMEVLFWKSSKECYEIEYGYTESSGKQAGQRAWSEQEEDEVRTLFMEHQQSGNETDVVDFVTENLIDQTKSRRQVLKKLKELMLLVDYRGKKKSGASRPPKQWSLEEEANLQELFEQFRESDDPLGNIMDNLDVARPRNRVLEKLLVMGLIQDKKEIRKKRSKQGKSHQRGSDNESYHSDLSDDDATSQRSTSSAGQIITHKRPNTLRKTASKNKTSTGKKRPNKHVPVSKTKIAQLLLKVMSDEMRESLEWLKESLGDAIEDYEVGNNEGIPLVPVMDYAETAMENVEFQQLLRALGVCPPFDEQEMYWRIPVTLTPQILQGYCDMIQQALENTLEIETEESVPESTHAETSDDEDVFNKLRAMTKSNNPEDEKADPDNLKTSHHRSPAILNGENEFESVQFTIQEFNVNDTEESNTDMMNTSAAVQESHDDSDDIPALVISEDQEDELNTSVRKKSKNIIDSDSEEEDGHRETEKRLRSTSGSDTDKPVTKRGRIIDSDED